MLIHSVPGALSAPDFIAMIQLCHGYIDKYGMDATTEGGYDHPKFRDTMTAIFGKSAIPLIAQLNINKIRPPSEA